MHTHSHLTCVLSRFACATWSPVTRRSTCDCTGCTCPDVTADDDSSSGGDDAGGSGGDDDWYYNCTDPTYTLTIIDSYGDGWNGAYFTWIDEDGVAQNTGTLDSTLASDTVSLCGDGCYSLAVSEGDYPEEISWSIESNSGETFAGVAGETVSMGPTYTLTIIDSYGDGWNGAYYSWIDEDGVAQNTGTLDSTLASDTVSLCGDGCYSLAVSEGDYPEEISWSIESNSGETFTGVAGETVSMGCQSTGIPTCEDGA